jgi:hypothetical protein
MEREIIERLAMDSAAGELNDDMRILFESYLAEHPDANRWAEDISQIYRLTNKAIQTKTIPAGSERPIRIKPLQRLNWLQITRWAAVIAITAFIGLVAGRLTRSPEVFQRPAKIVTSQTGTAGPENNLMDADEGFWKDKALAMLGNKPQHIESGSTGNDGLWDKYREYIKEKKL